MTRPALEKAGVLGNECLAPHIYLMTLVAPQTMKTCEPGQFVHLRLPHQEGELLRLPFSIYGTLSELGAIEVLYQVVGAGTSRMSELAMGETCDLLGPLGHGWNIPQKASRALLVGGGLGAAPLMMLAQKLAENGTKLDIVLGAPTRDRLVTMVQHERYGTVHVATDDGSLGLPGFCTQLSAALLQENHYDYVATCGPQPMQHIVARQCDELQVPCEVSLERLMACGIGACLSCVVKTKDGLKRACKEGPVFDAREVIWDD